MDEGHQKKIETYLDPASVDGVVVVVGEEDSVLEDDSFPDDDDVDENGAMRRLPVPRTIPMDLLASAAVSSVTSRTERAIDGGLSRTLKAARREALRRPAMRNAQDRGMVTMFAAARPMPIRRLGAYHGTRLRWS